MSYLSTAFDIDSVHFLDSLDLPFFKDPSGEITNLPYLLEIAATKKPVVMVYRNGRKDEIATAIDILKKNGTSEITLLQCHTVTPTVWKM